MKLSEYKKSIDKRLKLLVSISLFSFREAMAYPLNNWGGLVSTFIYTVTYIAFISIIFGRVKLIAGYNYSEIILLTLMGQIGFYSTWSFSMQGINRLGEIVKSGELDLVLCRPIPVIWYVSLLRLRFSSFLFDGLPALVPIFILMIRHHDYQVTLFGLMAGIALSIMGFILIHCFQFIASLIAFWTGEAENIRKMVEGVRDFGSTVPWEGFPISLKIIGLYLLPVLVQAALSTSYLVGKTKSLPLLAIVFFLTILFLFLKIKAWQFAIRHYSGASS